MRILAVTGSRADWGYLAMPLRLISASSQFELRLAVTGQHLEKSSGDTVSQIEAEGFRIDARIDLALQSDTELEVTRGVGSAVAGFGAEIDRIKPDLMLILGDRYEILAAAAAAMLARIPIAHLCGGDISEGAIDDSIRHALSKLSHLHFPTNGEAAARLIRMGEAPERVHMIGSTGLDRLLDVKPLPRAAFFTRLGMPERKRNLLVTMHPVTLAPDPVADARALVAALTELDSETGLIVTGTNADSGRLSVGALLRDFVAERPSAKLFASLGTELYVSAMTHCDAVIGNSSSGLYEAPSLSLPTVNVGSRQDGRLRAASVIDCGAGPVAILDAIRKALARGRQPAVNPYGDGQSSARLASVLTSIADPKALLRKTFYSGPLP